jgi:hypothetical protein
MVVTVRNVVITVVNRHDTPGGEYVGRPSALGNPYDTATHKRDEAIRAYTDWLFFKIETKDLKVCNELERLRKKALREKKLVLACWCVPLKCHASVIADALAKAIAGDASFTAVPAPGESRRSGHPRKS